ncbi:frequency clock protein [Jackrogersella minutella]|nr:frequency clock protein [Jackrogersella minutella]
MSDSKNVPAASRPPPITFKNPRRTTAEASITLQPYRLATTRNASPAAARSVPRRNSSGDSNETGQSAKNWFEASNKNAMANMDTRAMDLDPPFYQKETDESNEETAKFGISQSPAYEFIQSRLPGLRGGMDSSNEDFRSVIDDLTVENKRLKEELKKYKQMGPDSLRREKLFEVKVHGLSSRKKRELEAALRDFTTGLEDSSTGASSGRKKTSAKSKIVHSSLSKHASSSSGSNSKPVDSAYASMSNGPNLSVPSLPGQAKATRQQNEQKIENYLRDIPEGLWLRPTAMTEKEKKKLVVKRLEHLFTGKMGDLNEHNSIPLVPGPIAEDVQMEGVDEKVVLPTKTAREAQIRPRELRRKESSSRDNGSASNSHSNGDQTEPRDNGTGNGIGSGSGSGSGSGHASGVGLGNTTSPHTSMLPPEQRPTRPRDLDPDRRQVPSENMDYIRHLGLVAPESQEQFSARDVSPDAEGWVYLNLLCNLAQLHILNVTPAFIRNAVSEKSTKFQLSPDGRKIRWRGGVEGTRFSSDSGSYSQRNQSSDDTDGSNDQRKKQKTSASGNDVIAHKPSKFGLGVQDSNSTESFHYKPLFVHQQTSFSDEQPSGGDETGSSYGPPEESNLGMNSHWGQSGVSGASQRKRRRDGAIIYYSGAPFCTDLSGDFGDFGESEVSPVTYDMTSSGDQVDQGPASLGTTRTRPQVSRSTSGSSLPFRPLSAPDSRGTMMDLDGSDLRDLSSGETNDVIQANFPWSNSTQHASLVNLEASGLGGISPDDHFLYVVTTRRPKQTHCDENNGDDGDDEETSLNRERADERPSQETMDSKITTDSIIKKLATMTTRSPIPHHVPDIRAHEVHIEYLTGRIRRLPPVPLPPPAFYFPGDDSDFDDDDDDESGDDASSESLMSRRAIVEDDPGSDVDLSGNDEEDEHSDDGHAYDASGSISPEILDELPDISEFRRDRSGKGSVLSKITTGSSAATAGGAASSYNSSMDENA